MSENYKHSLANAKTTQFDEFIPYFSMTLLNMNSTCTCMSQSVREPAPNAGAGSWQDNESDQYMYVIIAEYSMLL